MSKHAFRRASARLALFRPCAVSAAAAFLFIAVGGPALAADRPVAMPSVAADDESRRVLTRPITVELHEGTNMAADVSPDGRQIVFSAQGALWRIPVEGGQATRITPQRIEPTAPVWSPDGRTIAFQNYTVDGNYHIWTVRPDGSGLRELTTGYFDDREPAWAPDGSAVIFASDRSDDGQYKVWRYTLASGEYHQLTPGDGAESNPVLSRQGQLAYVDAGQVKMLDLTTPGAQPQTVGPGSAPSWAPDGTLVWQRDARTLVGGGGQPLVVGEDLFPFPVRWMPDGRFLHTATGKIQIRNADGTSAEVVPFSAELTVRRPVHTRPRDQQFDNFGPRPVKGISAPVISPDGQRIAFVALNDVWVMRIGESPVRLTDDADRDGNVQWTPDGNAVYFSTEKENGGALAIDQIDINTKARHRLGAIPGKSMVTPKMSPDGTRIAYTALSGQLEIWNIAGQTSEFVVPEVSWQLSTPQWTPDGTRILIVDNERVNNRFREGYNKLRVINIADKMHSFYPVAEVPRQISDREEGAAVLSPDGTMLAFVMDSLLHVMPMNPNGSPAGEPRRISDEVADLPSWAGDSQTILYKSAEELRLVSADGSGRRTVPVDLQWTQATGEGRTVVHAGALWDGVSDSLQYDVDIVIERNRIVAIRPHRELWHRGVDRVVDASGLTVMPGLWDPHIHPLTLYRGGQYGQIAALMLSYGITSTLSVAGPLHQSIEMRESLEAGNLNGPRLFTSPPLWEGNRQFYSFARTLRTPEIAELEIAKAGRMGVDFLKSYVRAPIPVMTRIAAAGVRQGVPTGTHMLSPGTATGLGGTTHLSATQRMGYGWAKSINGITYQDAYDLHAKSGFSVIDTLFASVGVMVGLDPSLIGDERFDLLVSPNFVDSLQTQAGTAPSAQAIANLTRDAVQSGKVQAAGGLLALGTDSPLVAPGIALHTGLRAGALAYSNVQALKNVTINAARISMQDRHLGSVERGKLADLVAVQGDPLADLKAADDVQWVMKNGRVFTLPEILAPFRTPQARAQRAESLKAWRALCRYGRHACEHAAGHAH